MTFLIIVILLIFAWPYIWRWLQPYFYRWMQRRTEDYVRRAMGMPPRDKADSSRQQSYRSGDHRSSASHHRTNSSVHEQSVIPKEYAEDVEYTEFRSFSEEEEIGGDSSVSYKRESQVSDAEIIEIKKD